MSKPKKDDYMDKSFSLAIGLFSVTLAVLFFLQSALFSLQTVEVQGNVYMRSSDLLEIGGISYGQSIFNIDLRHARMQLSEHPQIESVRLSRRLPGTLRIDISEREPVAIIPTSQGFASLDRSGRVLQVFEEIRLPLPLLTGAESQPIEVGSQVHGTAMQEALRIAAALRPDLVAAISEIQTTPEGIQLVTRDLVTVQLGNTTQLDEKMTTLRALFRSLSSEKQKIERIDLRVPRTPVLK